MTGATINRPTRRAALTVWGVGRGAEGTATYPPS